MVLKLAFNDATRLAGVCAFFMALSVNASEVRVAPGLVDEALRCIATQQDLFHKSFIVYDDRDSGNEHFFPSQWMDDFTNATPKQAAGMIHGNCKDSPWSGTTCIQMTYPNSLRGKGWGGVFWTFPENQPLGPGYDLSRYKFTREKVWLKFVAKSDADGEIVTFAFRDAIVPEKIPVRFQTRLKTNWVEYCIDISSERLTNVTGGFAISAKRTKKTHSIYADNIRIEFGPRGTEMRLKDIHFVRSYVPQKAGEPDTYFRNSCFSYDNSLMALAYCARGWPDDLLRARAICDAFVKAQSNDPLHDGRIRNGYSCGDLIDTSRENVPRPPGSWNDKSNHWDQDFYSVGTDSGNMAWTAIALLEMWEKGGRDPRYLKSASNICEWINHRYVTGGLPGYAGGVSVSEENVYSNIKWKSCEHNIDIYVAFKRLAKAIPNSSWDGRAELARHFVEKMMDPHDRHLWTGTKEKDDVINQEVKPLDVNPWALMAFEDAKQFGPSVEWAANKCFARVKTATKDIAGYDFKSNDSELGASLITDPVDVAERGIWWEGTAQMQLAFSILGMKESAANTLESLRRHAKECMEKGGVSATTAAGDGLMTGFRREDAKHSLWVYWNRPHVGGATCWYIFAELGWNPYWGRPIEIPKNDL